LKHHEEGARGDLLAAPGVDLENDAGVPGAQTLELTLALDDHEALPRVHGLADAHEHLDLTSKVGANTDAVFTVSEHGHLEQRARRARRGKNADGGPRAAAVRSAERLPAVATAAVPTTTAAAAAVAVSTAAAAAVPATAATTATAAAAAAAVPTAAAAVPAAAATAAEPAAAATTATTAAAAAEPAAAAAEAAAAATIGALTGFVDAERAAIELAAVPRLDRGLGAFLGAHLDEREAAGLPGLLVVHDSHLGDRTGLAKGGAKRLVTSVVGEIADVELRTHLTLPFVRGILSPFAIRRETRKGLNPRRLSGGPAGVKKFVQVSRTFTVQGAPSSSSNLR
jgi:hypothetical protein